MWRDWRPEVVKGDLALMASTGLTVLRVFPLWPDFQPLNQLYGNRGSRAEIRVGEDVLDDTGPGFAGLDPVMLDRFDVLCAEAHSKGFSLIVGLITGWMSGRLFMPAGLAGRNPITDPVCLMWEVRFVAACERFDIPWRSYDGPDIVTPEGIYRPDFIINTTTVVDVKGWLRPESAVKIDQARAQGLSVVTITKEDLLALECGTPSLVSGAALL
jgi:hypothetical protein